MPSPWMQRRGPRFVTAMAILALLQGILIMVLALSDPETHTVGFLQGPLMVVLAWATYRGKLWGPVGLTALALFVAGESLYFTGGPGWISPLILYTCALVYRKSGMIH